MWAAFQKLVHDCLTENDGHSFDPFRVGGASLSLGAFPTYIWMGIMATLHNPMHPPLVEFAGGFATMMGGCALLAGGVAFKARTDTFNAPLDRHEDH